MRADLTGSRYERTIAANLNYVSIFRTRALAMSNPRKIFREGFAEGNEKLKEAKEAAATILARGADATEAERVELAILWDEVYLLPSLQGMYKFHVGSFHLKTKADIINKLVELAVSLPDNAALEDIEDRIREGKSKGGDGTVEDATGEVDINEDEQDRDRDPKHTRQNGTGSDEKGKTDGKGKKDAEAGKEGKGKGSEGR